MYPSKTFLEAVSPALWLACSADHFLHGCLSKLKRLDCRRLSSSSVSNDHGDVGITQFMKPHCARLLSYVDNWTLLADFHDHIPNLLCRMKGETDVLGLLLNPDKTLYLSSLAQVQGRHPQTSPLPWLSVALCFALWLHSIPVYPGKQNATRLVALPCVPSLKPGSLSLAPVFGCAHGKTCSPVMYHCCCRLVFRG